MEISEKIETKQNHGNFVCVLALLLCFNVPYGLLPCETDIDDDDFAPYNVRRQHHSKVKLRRAHACVCMCSSYIDEKVEGIEYKWNLIRKLPKVKNAHKKPIVRSNDEMKNLN